MGNMTRGKLSFMGKNFLLNGLKKNDCYFKIQIDVRRKNNLVKIVVFIISKHYAIKRIVINNFVIVFLFSFLFKEKNNEVYCVNN